MVPTSIPFYDFGGDGPPLHFAAPNAYTPETFRQFIAPFLDHFRVTAVYHRPLWPHSSPDELQGDWHIFADDLIAFLEQQGGQPVIGMGHSLGGVATAYAALKRPDLFTQLVLIDPVFLPPQVLAMAAQTDGPGNLPMVEQALRRRNRWESRQAAFERFRDKRAFKRWSDAALWDYVNFALKPAIDDPSGAAVELRWPREWEARIYGLPPQAVWETVARLTQPTLALRGTESDTLLPVSWAHWQQLQPQATFVELPDVGHMMMLERPLLVAETILTHLKPSQNMNGA